MEVVKFTGRSNDISAGLRHLAERIDAGELPDLKFVQAMTVDHNASFVCFAWGQCSLLETIGAMTRALANDLVVSSIEEIG